LILWTPIWQQNRWHKVLPFYKKKLFQKFWYILGWVIALFYYYFFCLKRAFLRPFFLSEPKLNFIFLYLKSGVISFVKPWKSALSYSYLSCQILILFNSHIKLKKFELNIRLIFLATIKHLKRHFFIFRTIFFLGI
jgi:hypothetical protein